MNKGTNRVKLPTACLWVLIVALLAASVAEAAGAAQSRRYALAYAWDTERQRILDYRRKVAASLGLKTDSQLKIVGREQDYGLVWNINASMVQAKKQAEQQSARLRRAGLKPVQVVACTGFSELYHVRVRQAARADALQGEYARLKNALESRAGDKLAIEKIDSRQWALVYRGWESKKEAQKSARNIASQLPRTSKAPVLVAAIDRPAVMTAADATLAEPPNTSAAAARSDRQRSQARQESGGGLNTKIAPLLQAELRKAKIQPQVRAGWAAYDLTTDNYLVSINLNRPFQAASMIKPFVALAFFHQVDKGKVSYTAQHRQMMEAMIQHSSNPATNWFIRQLGGPARCEALLKKEYGRLVGQIRIREYIPASGRTYLNSVQPCGYIQFLRALWRYQLPNSKEMLRVMGLPGPDRLVYGADLPNNTEVYNKTGTTALLCGDMGILVLRDKEGRKIPYAVVGIVERSSQPANYKQWMRASGGVIRDFSSLVYEEMKRKHNLL
ncbi:serine hydrolase [Desulfobulbus sp.]|uniref:serine hydrolase n=1 Tax=Desulfobulbus sp. TaxID=895 RepID=UPI00286F5845|nr:serine hydrolase [Desulfobulbus sp.]